MGTDGDDGVVGLVEAVAIEAGRILGAGLFSLTGVAAGFAGTGLPLASSISARTSSRRR